MAKSARRFHLGLIRNKHGFTLVEVLSVVLILGILVGIAIPLIANAQKGPRDKERLQAMKSIMEALERYFDKNGYYPSSDGEGTGGWDTPGDGDFIHALTTGGFLKKDFKDPKTNDFNGNYRYYRYGAGNYGADSNKGAYYVLGVVDMETVKPPGPHPDSPGFKTPGRNWQNEMEWVTGKYEGSWTE